jgi:rhodanese-related sulfurtransferase
MADAQSDPIEIGPQQASQLRDEGALIVDVREDSEWQAGRIPGATHIPLMQLSEQAGSLPADRAIVFQCKVGGRSLMAAQALRAAGRQAYSLAGGLHAWQDAGLSLEPEDGVVADH